MPIVNLTTAHVAKQCLLVSAVSAQLRFSYCFFNWLKTIISCGKNLCFTTVTITVTDVLLRINNHCSHIFMEGFMPALMQMIVWFNEICIL